MFLFISVVRKGDKLGWGLHYLPPIREGGTVKQPMICCVSLNGSFQTSVCYLEPEGGYYPFIAFTAQGECGLIFGRIGIILFCSLHLSLSFLPVLRIVIHPP